MKSAFTGAVVAKRGLIEVAEGGTLFVDEVAEMAPALQARLLRVLEDGTFRRVGSADESKADVRIIAASNKDLEAEQKAGRFREDSLLSAQRGRNSAAAFARVARHSRSRRSFSLDAASRAKEIHGRAAVWPHSSATIGRAIFASWPMCSNAQILADGETITIDDLPRALTVTSATAIRRESLRPHGHGTKARGQSVAHMNDNRLAARLLDITPYALSHDGTVWHQLGLRERKDRGLCDAK